MTTASANNSWASLLPFLLSRESSLAMMSSISHTKLERDILTLSHFLVAEYFMFRRWIRYKFCFLRFRNRNTFLLWSVEVSGISESGFPCDSQLPPLPSPEDQRFQPRWSSPSAGHLLWETMQAGCYFRASPQSTRHIPVITFLVATPTQFLWPHGKYFHFHFSKVPSGEQDVLQNMNLLMKYPPSNCTLP